MVKAKLMDDTEETADEHVKKLMVERRSLWNRQTT
jgi:hypothetical protein